MTIALIIIAVMVSPVLFGPLMVPPLHRRTERKTLERLKEASAQLPPGQDVVFQNLGIPRLRCEAKRLVAASFIKCGGPLHEVVEHFRAPMKTSADEGGTRDVAVKVGTLCPLCGDFRPGPGTPHVLDERLLEARTADAVLMLITDRARPGLPSATRKALPAGS